MAGLTGQTVASTYKSLLRVEDNTNGVDSSLAVVSDGQGDDSGLLIAKNSVQVKPSASNNDAIFSTKNNGGDYLLRVDADNSVVKANVGQDIVNTQYATFHMNSAWWSGAADDTHTALAFGANQTSAIVGFGTGTDPATTFTTAEGSGTRSGELVPCLWYVNDNITIDSIVSIEGADAATGDTTRMHLFSYTFNSGSTSALTSGTLLAHNSDVTNAGSEQAYKTTWTIDSSDVNSGKVIMAFLKSDSINSDFSANVYIKYHLR